MRLLAMLPLMALAACLEPAAPERAARHALGSGDASAVDLLGGDRGGDGDELFCTRIPPVGCCNGETLWWCEQGHPHSKSCATALHCGWSNSGFYDCNTSGAQDPSGRNARDCTSPVLPRRDATVQDGAAPCGAVTGAGCCEGNVLKYCDSGKLRVLSCALNASCGWLANAQLYDCGTPGQPDPQGKLPMACPPPHLDARFEGPADWGDLTRWPELGGDAAPKNGCSCDVHVQSSRGGDVAFAILVLMTGGVVLRARRRWSRSMSPSTGR